MFASVFAACASSDDGAAAGSMAASCTAGADCVPRESFLAEYASAFCDTIGDCCTASGAAYDPEGCKTLFHGNNDLERVLPLPTVGYDPVQATKYLDEVRKYQAGCGAAPPPTTRVETVFIGTLPVGSPCTVGYECTPGSYCEYSGAEQGRCVAEPVRGAAGDACNGTCRGTSCDTFPPPPGGAPPPPALCHNEDGLYCDGAAQRCEPTLAFGQACLYTKQCREGTCAQGVCAAPSGPDQSCMQDEDCAAPLSCELDTMTCAAPRATGERCRGSRSCATGMCDPRFDVCMALTVPVAYCDGVVQ